MNSLVNINLNSFTSMPIKHEKMKIFTILLLFCGISQVSLGQINTVQKDEANTALNSAYKLLYQGGDRSKNLDSVIVLCSKVIKIDSTRVLAYSLKSTALTMQGKPLPATLPLTQWLNSHPDDLEILLRRGLMYEKLQKPQQANTDFEKLTSLMNKRAIKIENGMTKKQLDSTVAAAQIYYAIGKTEKALTLLKKLEMVFPAEAQLKVISSTFAKEDRAKLIYNILGF